ncbi:MAG: hypothetical protein GY791_13700 [Alphaproteobacteria bacterium]|nr:hypothetical protein [Alphaproteobacteria bacterium]
MSKLRDDICAEARMRFTKASGLTPSEKVLSNLCDRSFLSFWSYPNLYRAVAKELCDLLVVFGDDIVIFSDKSCAYPDSGDAALDWSRWYRRSIARSAHQIHRAENWVQKSPERIFLDAKCARPLPIVLPPGTNLRVHRVCIALGASDRAMAETGRRDVTISAIAEDDSERFTVGKINAAQGLVHVFNEITLPIVLSELSTTADFLDYLRKKEALFDSGRFAFAESELDLLGYFLWHNREFPIPSSTPFRLEPNLWQQVEADAQFLAAREENEISFLWDGLIGYLTNLYMNEDLGQGNEIAITDYERAVRVMAGETRFSRRLLAKWILERVERARDGYIGSCFPSPQEDVLYVLLVGPGDRGQDHARYRKARSEQLHARCIAGKATMPDRRFIVGIALDARGVQGSSEDFIYLDTEEWTKKALENAEQLRQEWGYIVEGMAQMVEVAEAEYPGTEA